MNISNNFITQIKSKQTQPLAKALSFKAEEKKDEVTLKSDDSEELIKPNKTATRIFSLLIPAGIAWMASTKNILFIPIGALIGSAFGEIAIKQTEINDRLKKLESKTK